jgi:hypothetical protein
MHSNPDDCNTQMICSSHRSSSSSFHDRTRRPRYLIRLAVNNDRDVLACLVGACGRVHLSGV